MLRRPALLVALAAGFCCGLSFSGGALSDCFLAAGGKTRRASLLAAGIAGLIAGGPGGAGDVQAFGNAVRKIGGLKTPGPRPGDLGVMARGESNRDGEEILQLKQCNVKSPNCFSSNFEVFDKGTRDLAPWRFEGKSPAEAMKEVAAVVKAYPPGQGELNIDGGGFEVQSENDKYLYVVFASLKKGYQDDVEFALAPNTSPDAKSGEVQLRSGSRQGFYDFGVNAARLNWIANALTQQGGWTAPQIDSTNHPGYWQQGNCKVGDVAEKFPQYCSR